MKKKKGCLGCIAGPLFLIIILFGIVGSIIGPNDSNTKTEKETEKQTEARHFSETQKTGVTGIEVAVKEEADNFDYELFGDTIILNRYNGKSDIVELKTSYVVDGIEYRTDISDFQIGLSNNKAKAVIIDEGFAEVKTAIFNCSDVRVVFFPKSMTNVYDYTLAYMTPEENNKIKIYYAGTQDEWAEIFTKYQRTKVGDAHGAEEIGSALADKMNEWIGVEYDSAEYEYFFSATPDDLRRNFD